MSSSTEAPTSAARSRWASGRTARSSAQTTYELGTEVHAGSAIGSSGTRLAIGRARLIANSASAGSVRLYSRSRAPGSSRTTPSAPATMHARNSGSPQSSVPAAGGLTGPRQAPGDEREVRRLVTGGRDHEPGVAVADEVDGARDGPARRPPRARAHVVEETGERQVDGVRLDPAPGELLDDEQPAPSGQMRSVDEQHRGVLTAGCAATGGARGYRYTLLLV